MKDDIRKIEFHEEFWISRNSLGTIRIFCAKPEFLENVGNTGSIWNFSRTLDSGISITNEPALWALEGYYIKKINFSLYEKRNSWPISFKELKRNLIREEKRIDLFRKLNNILEKLEKFNPKLIYLAEVKEENEG